MICVHINKIYLKAKRNTIPSMPALDSFASAFTSLIAAKCERSAPLKMIYIENIEIGEEINVVSCKRRPKFTMKDQ